ncbi:type II toxin-antitoxin system HicB family antitoxin [Sphingomonas hankyongi]|uniref:Type II toxin-antitoxin system HicB family antitoxin n=1 Tax=Sphingomonas hankyongi TaxID=2908209 RepID=A0ABT0RY98_9SPHN|nr:type II toxin-antitoxin system HicB family antitoxin [Sphingomonas hankyongi]MCL6728594.1 type II toxin-antitoxin system HicB family antitoxin [Sphingomonas hankyongi]
MKNVITHKGYQARVEFDADDGIFVGRIAGIDDNVGFHSDNVQGLVEAFYEAVDDYLSTCAKIGKTPERSYSGNVYLRVPESTHAKAAKAADLAGMSLNEFGEEALEIAADRLLKAIACSLRDLEDEADCPLEMRMHHATSA